MSRRARVAATLWILLASACVHAESTSISSWHGDVVLQGLASQYSGSTVRDSLTNAGFFVRADYLERAGFTVGLNRTVLSHTDGSADIDQDNVFASGRLSLTPDALPGRLTLRLDAYDLSNDDGSGITDAVTVLAPQIAYLNFAGTFYADIGFARSTYGADTPSAPALAIDQLTPTVGFGTRTGRDWLKLRAYLIDASDPARAEGQSSTSALELGWTHWFSGRGPLRLRQFRMSVLGGERLFAVDPDAASVYNLSELQTGAVSLGGEWSLGERNALLLLVGAEDYESPVLGTGYSSRFLYLGFTHEWD